MKQYVKWQLALLQAGRIKGTSLGGFAYKLPQGKRAGKAADLPAVVRAFAQSGRLGRIQFGHFGFESLALTWPLFEH